MSKNEVYHLSKTHLLECRDFLFIERKKRPIDGLSTALEISSQGGILVGLA